MRITEKFGALLLALSITTACSDSGGSSQSDTQPDPKDNQNGVSLGILNGSIIHSTGIEGVSVSVNGLQTQTDSNGVFQLANIPMKGDRWLVTLQKAGFVDSQKIIQIQEGQDQYQLNAFLTQPDSTQVVDLTIEQNLKTSGNEIQLALPANAIQGGDAESTITLTYGDPSTEHGQSIFPGDFSATNDPNVAPSVLLESIGFLDITATSKDGNDLTQLSEPAEVTLRLPSQYQSGGERAGEYQHGDSIPWWSYDEALGTWLREDADPSTEELDDAAIIENSGVLYAIASVTHFSWWNVDKPIEEHACVTVNVVDNDNQPLSNQAVHIQGNTFQFSTSAMTDSLGNASLTVKRSLDSSNPESFSLYTVLGGSKLYYDVTSPAEGITESNLIFSPTEAGSSIGGNASGCVALDNALRVAFDGRINGTLLDTNRNPIPNTLVYTDLAQSIQTNEHGEFHFEVPLNVDVYIIIPDLHTKLYEVTTEEPSINIEIIAGNQPPLIQGINLTPETGIKIGDDVSISATVMDPDNDALTLTWSSPLGLFSDTQSANTTWTAPSESGSTQLTLTISDGIHADVSKSVFISWSEIAVAQNFTLQARVLEGQAISLSGITIVLHGEDNVSIEQVQQTDETGLVDFGVIDRDRVSYTIIETQTNPDYPEQLSYSLSTHLNSLNQPMQFFIDTVTESSGSGCDSTQTYRVKVTNIPDNAAQVQSPGQASHLSLEVGDAEQSLTMCTSFGGTPISGFVFTVYGSSQAIGHSQYIEQFLENGVTEIDLSKQFIEVPVVNNLGVDAAVYAVDLSKPYHSISIYDYQTNRLRFYDLPISSYYFFASSEDSQEYYDFSWSSDQRPESIVLNKPAFSLSDIQFNELNQTVSWQANNIQQADAVQISLASQSNRWHLMAPAGVTQITLPQLPEGYSDLRDLGNFLYQRNVGLSDYLDFNTLDELVNFLLVQEPSLEQLIGLGRTSVEYEKAEPH